MECQFAFICDFAEQDRKLHAVGIGWDTLFPPQLPFNHSHMSVVARLRGSIAENGTKTVVLRLIDADGVDVIPLLEQPLPFEVKAPAVEAGASLVFNLIGLQFSKYGSYAFHLLLNGNEVTRVPFSVSKPPTTA